MIHNLEQVTLQNSTQSVTAILLGVSSILILILNM